MSIRGAYDVANLGRLFGLSVNVRILVPRFNFLRFLPASVLFASLHAGIVAAQ